MADLSDEDRKERIRQSKIRYYEKNKQKVIDRAALWKQENREKVIAADVVYRRNHKEQAIQRKRKWRNENPNLVAASNKRCVAARKDRNPNWKTEAAEKYAVYAEANRDRMRKRTAEYRKKNIDRITEWNAEYQANHPNMARISRQNRRARLIANGGVLSKRIVERLMVLQGGKCACCGKPLGGEYHLDHRMPLFLGGTNTDMNMQLLTPTCNLQKSKKHPNDFMQERGFLL